MTSCVDDIFPEFIVGFPERCKGGCQRADEKRRQISVRDMIRFSDINDASRTLLTEVKELFVFDSFEALYKALPLTECGYTDETARTASPEDMRKYYTPEQEKKYGVLGIKIELISQ